MNQRTQFDAIPADECNAGEIAQPQAPGNEQDVVRPSYIGSCEPAELSEENALNFVENFLIFNNLNLSPEVHCAKRVKEGSPFFPGAKGIRDVAKRISLSSSNQGTEIFEWADTPQVVKHWDIMKSRRKEAVASANDSESVDRHSESVRHVAEVHRQKVNHEHIVDVNQHVNEETSEQLLSSSVLGGEIAETFDVGFCTQMAAEAMEALSRVAYSSSPLFYQDPQSTYSTSPEDERDKVACLDKSPKKVYARSLSKQRQLSTRRQGTSASSPKHPERQKSDSKSVTQKKVKSGSSLVEKSALEESISRSKRILGSSIAPMRQRRDVGTLQSNNRKEVDGHVGLSLRPNNFSSRKRRSQNNMVDINSVCPTARQLTSRARPNMAKDSKRRRSDIKDIYMPKSKMVKSTSHHDRFKNSSRSEQSIVISDASEVAKNGEVNRQEQIGLTIDFSGVLSGMATWKYPRGKRSNRNLRRIQNGDINLETATKGMRNGSSSRKFISSTNFSFSNNGVSIKANQFARNSSPLPSENKVENKVEGGLTMQKSISKSVMPGYKESLPDLPWKELRNRRHMASVRVLFSLHLDHDIIMQQKKILKRLGISAASSSEDATHFVADTFARTRNMLEAIALGKPVVTHLWLESCAQAGCLIDERNFILRDARKEKELSFNMAASLANARQYPILKGRKVFITQRVKPSTEMLTSLVKAVHGQVIEKNQIPTTIDGKIPDEVLIISCEEDQTDCAPLLNKGAMVGSSELILSGVVTQKLDYKRHDLFKANVRTSGIT
ncbi:uncharacterized protein LOC116187196 [Punica granatum]|uniref:Uncharacterized protein LOC116187196 n=1 Tax=Punica granatum TaxID=22663 RepID=A0A6P8BNU6_PUNGR|nr:uncharacterized protein LOC116187196 [Punica granatum]